MRAGHRLLTLLCAILLLAAPVQAETKLKRTSLQYIAALAAPTDTNGTNAQEWGIWVEDPGPRGVWLNMLPVLSATGYAPAGWKFDPQEWWLEEHGLIMEKPQFPLPPGQYVVSGGREVTAVLTVGEPDANGAQSWQLADNATLGDVTHLACRSARYTPDQTAACTPDKAQQSAFPVSPGATMPPVSDCAKQDFAVLFVIGMMVDS